MTKYIIPIFLFILSLNSSAQDLTVSFHTNDNSTVIDSVLAVNLNTNDSVMLAGNETLTLKNTTTGITSFLNGNTSLYPNPTDGTATLQFPTNSGGEVCIRLFNTSGQLLLNEKQNLSAGMHNFTVRFPEAGVYVVSAQAGNTLLNFKEISTQTEKQEVLLSYSGCSPLFSETINEMETKSANANKTLGYSEGNNMMYTFYSGVNMRVMVDQPTESKTYGVTFYECTDNDGRSYKTVTIGTQVWMAENLAYLPGINPPTDETADSPCYYVYGYKKTNLSEAKSTDEYKKYGALYNWPAAINVCPTGWHLPTHGEWSTLYAYLADDGYDYSHSGWGEFNKSLAATYGWNRIDTEGSIGYEPLNNNASGFSALPGGYCNSGGFSQAVLYAYWWSCTEKESFTAYNRYLSYGTGRALNFYNFYNEKKRGYSVRCIKD